MTKWGRNIKSDIFLLLVFMRCDLWDVEDLFGSLLGLKIKKKGIKTPGRKAKCFFALCVFSVGVWTFEISVLEGPGEF
jgi:hypothetical protein